MTRAQVITLLATSTVKADIGNLWFAVPYHTTAVRAAESLHARRDETALRVYVRHGQCLCGTGTTVTCGTATAGTLVLRLGESRASAGLLYRFPPGGQDLYSGLTSSRVRKRNLRREI